LTKAGCYNIARCCPHKSFAGNSIVPDIEEFFKAPYEDVLLEEIELNLTSG
jgi:hypothetical protein